MTRIHSLGYVGFQSPQVAEWLPFANDVFGLECDLDESGAAQIRWDDRMYRMRIVPGEDDRLLYLGWETGNRLDFAAVIEDLRGKGVEVVDESPELADERRVSALASFSDPFGVRHEVFYGQGHMDRTFRGQRATSSFITGDQGLGHAVLIVPDMEEASRFYEDTLGFKCSDVVDVGLGPMAFLRCNPRHHSLAIWGIPGALGLNHVMVESTDIDDVGRAYDLAQRSEYEISASLGRHAGDEQLSFYTRTPSGFDLEFGADSLVIDDDDAWTMRRLDRRWGNRSEIWGHQFRPLPPQSSVHPYPAEVAP
ncbi:VOC family protein [Demequina sp. NBRC 110054]|uniref:VOC family protein n=1 Tax=Demequina sp. NBRC 110054 TaxID=1570343 RepID=UPI000A017BBA|nr:VOC family protein [Demequina sp. NBRC 110054]